MNARFFVSTLLGSLWCSLLPTTVAAENLRTVDNGIDVNNQGWVLTSGSTPTIDIPGQAPISLSGLKGLAIPYSLNEEGDVVSRPTDESGSCVVYRYQYASKKTSRFVVSTALESYDCQNSSVALSPNTPTFAFIKGTSTGEGENLVFEGTFISDSGVASPFSLSAKLKNSDDYAYLQSAYISSDNRLILPISGSRNVVKVISSTGVEEKEFTNPLDTIFQTNENSSILVGTKDSAIVTENLNDDSSTRLRIKGPKGSQFYSSAIGSARRDGTAVGYANVTSAPIAEPDHAFLSRPRRPAVDVNCVYPNSVGHFSGAYDLTDTGYFLTTLQRKDGTTTTAVLQDKALLHKSNFCSALKAKMTGSCDKYFQNTKSGDTITQTVTYPLNKQPVCSMKVTLTDSKGTPLAGRTIALVGGDSAPEVRASGTTNKAGVATVTYPINASESRSWELLFWNDRMFRPSSVPVKVKNLDY